VNSPPFFIVGSGRSGTTLLRMILASHSHLAIPPETWYMLRLLEKFDPKQPLSPDDIRTAAKIMTGHYRWPDMNIDAKEFTREALELKNPSLSDVVEIVYRKHLDRENKPRWGDKTPGYIQIVPELIAMFPDAKFIHFYRDGRDVARSFQAQGWYGRWLHDNAREWNEALDYNKRWRSSPLAHRILQVRYEDLVLDTEKTLRDICHFLDEKYEPQMQSWQGHIDQLVPAREAHIHVKLNHTPNPEDVYRWKREMTTREIFVAEAFMGRHLEEMGYERRFRGGMWPIALGMTRWYCRTVLPVISLPVRAVRWLRDRLLGRAAFRPRARRS
jgi:hypothetical protein